MKKKLSLVLIMILLTVTCLMVLTACLPANLDAAKKKLEKEDFRITELKLEGFEGLKGGFTARGTDPKCEVSALYFDSAANAKKAYEIVKAKQETSYVEVYQNGKWVYYGDTVGIEYFEW